MAKQIRPRDGALVLAAWLVAVSLTLAAPEAFGAATVRF